VLLIVRRMRKAAAWTALPRFANSEADLIGDPPAR
jgi:hypothetical protein